MKILSIAISRWNSDTEDPIILDAAFNLAEYSFFVRGSMKEFFTFASKTIMKRVPAGVHCIDYEGESGEHRCGTGCGCGAGRLDGA